MEIPEKPFCFYVGRTFTDRSGHFFPAIVVEGEPGYYRTDWDYGADFDLAKEAVDSLNTSRGISVDEVFRIVTSSMFPARRTRREPLPPRA